MATMTISTALITDITDSLTYRKASDSNWEYNTGYNGNSFGAIARESYANTNNGGSLLGAYSGVYVGTNYFYQVDGITTYDQVNNSEYVKFEFRNAANTALITYKAGEIISRSMDENGYCVLSNFPEKTPSNAGTIDYIYVYATSDTFARTITLSVGASGSGADVEFDDRTLVTTQPWRLDGTIKFRAPISYTWST